MDVVVKKNPLVLAAGSFKLKLYTAFFLSRLFFILRIMFDKNTACKVCLSVV